MASGPSVGDILMLSQLAWKIGRAFTQGRKGALSEFTEVERESNGLSEALKLVAETLYSDNSILTQADEHTHQAVSTILDSAHKTLSDLDSFVERYRVIKKKETKGGFVVERTWSEVVIANYKTLKWTTEGGDIIELRNMLHMHTSTIDLTLQALQSKSLSRLESTVIPMAENVASIHDTVQGELTAKIDDLHRIIMSIANGTPSLKPLEDDDSGRQPSVSESTTSNFTPTSPLSLRSRQSNTSTQDGQPRIPTRHPNRPVSPPVEQRARGDSAYFSMGMSPRESDSKRADWVFEGGSPPDRSSIGVTISIPPSGTTAVATPSSNTFTMEPNDKRHTPRRESQTVPFLFSTFDDDADGYGQQAYKRSYPPHRQVLPPPAIPQEDEETQTPATPSSFFQSPRPIRTESNLSAKAGASPRPDTPKSVRKRPSFRAEVSQAISDAGQKFEKALFRNAAILCDVRGTLVEYAQHIPDEPDPRYNTEMVEACTDCRIFVIRKRESRPHGGGSKIVSSIWAISDDGAVRMQQQLPEFNETVPYCSYFQPEKVSLPPSYGDMTLRFHPEVLGADINKESKSNWINYVFESEEGANQFQSAIFGRTLLGSFRTTKTTVIHDGFKGAFAFEEQFANIEVLRLWEDDGITTAGASGGVLALMHLGSNFGEGWARWWMNSSKQHVRVKDEQTKFAKIKGIDIRTVKPGTSAADRARQAQLAEEGGSKKKSPEKRVTGVRVEFKNEEEREKFVKLVQRVQERMLPLPDV